MWAVLIPSVVASFLLGREMERSSVVKTGRDPLYARQRMPNFRPMPRGEALVEDAPYGQLGQFRQPSSFNTPTGMDVDNSPESDSNIISGVKFGLARYGGFQRGQGSSAAERLFSSR